MYPYAPHAAHVVGYMGAITKEQKDDVPRQGLRAQRTGRPVRCRDEHGVGAARNVGQAGLRGRRRRAPGAPDRGRPADRRLRRPAHDRPRLQQYAEQALETTLEVRRTQLAPNPKVLKPDGEREKMDPTLPDDVPYKAPAGVGDRDGLRHRQIMALASYPTFDNRWFEAGLSSEKFKRDLPATPRTRSTRSVDPRQPRRPGPVQHGFDVQAVHRLRRPQHRVDLGGRAVQRRGRVHACTAVDQGRCDAGLVRCEYKNATCAGTQRPCRYGPVNVEDALAISSDAFFYRIGED